ncbi:flagellar export protein FliJ [Lentibacillus sediminis]|uniref:flagellar export protein FliJ n=1 Tax=Lentibacillus sediminis TaxID=1940529 RepID=UPI000C1BFE01|nr:flagellar export protein FliJ [Lentibacillus sediminis]
MAETAALTKILHVRENEKKDAQMAYHQAMYVFEEIATKLYTLLKKKEKAEESYESYLHTPASLDVIKQQSAYIERLNRQIMDLQQDVLEARSHMESKQHVLKDAHIEVKKFEKIIETRKQSEAEVLKKTEKASMDEISLQQFRSGRYR